jgi:phage baseplate assembly protein W
MAVVQKKRLFYGYSTVETNSKKQQFADIELIKRDLLNHFYTRKGERVMMPTYGCGIWEMFFDQFNDLTKDLITEECTKVITADSRVQLQSIFVDQLDQGFVVQMDLLYVPYNVIDSFTVQFDNRTISNF